MVSYYHNRKATKTASFHSATVCYTTRGEKPAMVSPSHEHCMLTCLARCAHCYNGGMTVTWVTNQLDLRSTPLEEIHTWFCRKGQKPISTESIGPRENPATIALLYGHIIRPVSKYPTYSLDYCCPQPWPEKLLSVAVNAETTGTSTENKLPTMCSALNGTPISNTPTPTKAQGASHLG